MPRKSSKKRTRSWAALPVAAAAGVSFAMADEASARAPVMDVSSQDTGKTIVLAEVEVAEVSLGTFYVFDREMESSPRLRFAGGGHHGGCGGHHGGCGGHGGCGAMVGAEAMVAAEAMVGAEVMVAAEDAGAAEGAAAAEDAEGAAWEVAVCGLQVFESAPSPAASLGPFPLVQ